MLLILIKAARHDLFQCISALINTLSTYIGVFRRIRNHEYDGVVLHIFSKYV